MVHNDEEEGSVRHILLMAAMGLVLMAGSCLWMDVLVTETPAPAVQEVSR